MENAPPNTRTARVYNWPDGKLDKPPMHSCKIYFSHPVEIKSIYLDDFNKTPFDFDPTYENKKVTIQLTNADVPVSGNPRDAVMIKFTTIHPYVKMENFVWYVEKGAMGPNKIATPEQLKKFNDYFCMVPPPPPVITQPHEGDSTSNETPKIKGTAQANSTIAVFVDGVKVGTTKSDNAGEFGVWVFQISTPLDPKKNKFKFTARLIYFDGEESEESLPVYYTITRQKPTPTK